MRVAQAFGQDPWLVAARPFAVTAWAFLTLLETEEFDDLKADARGLQAASRTAIAFNDPKRLEEERVALLGRMRGNAPADVAAARARGRRMVEQIAAGRVLDDAPGPSEVMDGH